MTTNVQVTPTETAAGVAQLLGPLVVELTALSITGKQAHWHVRGANFVPVHELLDSIVSNARDWTDLAAERIVALGAPLDVTVATVARDTATGAFPAGFVSTEDAIAEFLKHMDIVIAKGRDIIRPLGELDETSQDIAIEIQRGLEKDRWFLDSSRSA